MDKIPIKTLLDHAKQPFIPYTTAKSVMWDGTDKTLYDVVMEGVPVPEASTEAMPTFLIKDNSSVNPLVLCDCEPGIYLKPSPTSGAITWWLAGESGATAKQIYTSNQGIFVTEQPTPETINSTVFYQNNNLINCVLNYSSSKRLTESTLNRPEYLMNSSGTSTLLYSQVMFNKIPTFASNLTPANTEDVVNKGYVDGAITSAIEENNTGLNADIMVAINSAGRAEMQVEQKVDIANTDISNQTTTILALTKALGAAGKHYARWYTFSDGSSSGISDKPTGSTNGSFVCTATCNRYVSASDFRYILMCWVQSTAQPYIATVDSTTTSITWNQLVAKTVVDTKQNKITYGTGDPSGGSDGDVYLKYTA